MSVLEREIIEKFHQLDKVAQQRVRALADDPLNEIDHSQLGKQN